MSDRRGCQCPFTERVDHRCSAYFSIDRLNHAFDHCFGDYRACPLYEELLEERTKKRTFAGRVATWLNSREDAIVRQADTRPTVMNNAVHGHATAVPLTISAARIAAASADAHAESAAAA